MLDLVYRIEKKESHILLVHLEEKGTKRVLYLDQLKKILEPKEQEALAFLISIHLRSPNVSRQKETATFQKIEVPSSQAYQAAMLLAKTGKLFFQKEKISFNPIAAPLTWKGEKHSPSSSTVCAYLGEEPLSEAKFLFPSIPYLAISNKSSFFQPIATEIPWIWIERFSQGPLLLEGVLQKKFFEEEPVITWTVKEEKPICVFPELILQDATGCFAHLWMDYSSVGRIAFEDLSPTIKGKARLKEEELLWEKDLLEAGFIRKVVGASRYFCPSDQVGSTLRFLLELGWKIFDCQGRQVFRQTGMHISVQDKEENIQVFAKAIFQEKQTFLSSPKRGLWLDIDSQSIGLIDPKNFKPFEPLLEEGVNEKDSSLLLPRHKIALLFSLEGSCELEWGEKWKSLVAGWSFHVEEALADDSFHGTLLGYQQKGLDWLWHLYRCGFSGLLADEMGLGKTVQVLAFFSRLRKNLPILVVAPTSLLINWSRECSKFLPSLSVLIHSGKDRHQDEAALQNASLIITSYATLRQDEKIFKNLSYEAIVLDESQAIKNSQTQIARALCQLRANFRLCLSGTPLENRLEEFVSQFEFLLPKLLSKGNSLEQVKKKTRPFFLRRRKEDVQIELPEKIEQICWVEMTEEQKLMYLRYQSHLKKGLILKVEQDGASTHRMEILEAILRLRQICSDPRLLGESFLGSKVEQLQEDLAEMIEEGRKILVYSQFTSFLTLLKRDLAIYTPLYLDGTMGYEQRGAQVQQFQNDPSQRLFLLSLKAGGVGLNLTAADTVIILDPWWNEAVERQAIDRAHRMGQIKNVLAKRYLSPNSIEEKILQLKEKKQSLSEQLMSDRGELEQWSADDLLDLLLE